MNDTKDKIPTMEWAVAEIDTTTTENQAKECKSNNLYTAKSAEETRVNVHNFLKRAYGDLSNATIKDDTTASFHW